MKTSNDSTWECGRKKAQEPIQKNEVQSLLFCDLLRLFAAVSLQGRATA